MLHTYEPPGYVTPLNIVAKETDETETVVELIANHDFSNTQGKKWLVRWLTVKESWEQYENLKNMEAFQQTWPLSSKTDHTVLQFGLYPIQADSDGSFHLSTRWIFGNTHDTSS